MPELTIPLTEEEWAALADLADAQGRSVEDVALDALRHHTDAEQSRVRHHALRLAVRHASLLKRLGE
ncbi:hypothetical protein OHS70_23265 [Streptomyces sp. NBC_00390]|uniref:hypothetical protein n=1 Tax=Streptomyces sp. NBC_00390 TaxID=2975736 RepID=UPI002E24057A